MYVPLQGGDPQWKWFKQNVFSLYKISHCANYAIKVLNQIVGQAALKPIYANNIKINYIFFKMLTPNIIYLKGVTAIVLEKSFRL